MHGDSPGAVAIAARGHDALTALLRAYRINAFAGKRTVTRFLAVGGRPLLAEVDDLDAALALYAALRAARLPGVIDLVPAARTVLIRLDPTVTSPAAVREATAALRPGVPPSPNAGSVEIPVVYDGPDLAEVAERLGMTPDEVVARHTGAPMDGRVRRVRAGLRLPDRRRSDAGRAPAGFAADPDPGRVGRARGPVLRRLPARQPGRLAAHRHHRPPACGTSPGRNPRCSSPASG